MEGFLGRVLGTIIINFPPGSADDACGIELGKINGAEHYGQSRAKVG